MADTAAAAKSNVRSVTEGKAVFEVGGGTKISTGISLGVCVPLKRACRISSLTELSTVSGGGGVYVELSKAHSGLLRSSLIQHCSFTTYLIPVSTSMDD